MHIRYQYMEPRIPDPLSAAQNPDGWLVIARCLSGFRRFRGHACVRLCVCTLYTLTYDNDTLTDEQTPIVQNC